MRRDKLKVHLKQQIGQVEREKYISEVNDVYTFVEMASLSEADIKQAFAQFDTDNSGEINARELVNVLSVLYSDKDDTDIKAIAHVCVYLVDLNYRCTISKTVKTALCWDLEW